MFRKFVGEMGSPYQLADRVEMVRRFAGSNVGMQLHRRRSLQRRAGRGLLRNRHCGTARPKASSATAAAVAGGKWKSALRRRACNACRACAGVLFVSVLKLNLRLGAAFAEAALRISGGVAPPFQLQRSYASRTD